MAVLVPSLDNPVYHQAIRLRGYTWRVTVFMTVSDLDGAKLLQKLNPDWTQDDHKRLSALHEEMATRQTGEWNRLFDKAAMETFGRPSLFSDYKISAIGREEFSDEMKEQLRFAAHSAGSHRTLARVHEKASKLRSTK